MQEAEDREEWEQSMRESVSTPSHYPMKSIQALQTTSIRYSNKSFDSQVHKRSREMERMVEAEKFVKKMRGQKAKFQGQMFLIKQREEEAKQKKQILYGLQKQEQKLQKRKNKLGVIFENLEEYEKRKYKRSEDIKKFKKELYRLKHEKPLYQQKEEEYMEKVELPIIQQREEELKKSKKKPVDLMKDIADFQDRIFHLKRQHNVQKIKEEKEREISLSPIQLKKHRLLYKGHYYRQAERSRTHNQKHEREQIQQRRKRYSLQVKYYIEPHLIVMPKSDRMETSVKKSSPTRESQQLLGKGYLQYSKGYNKTKKFRTQSPSEPQLGATEPTGLQQSRNLSKLPQTPMTLEDDNRYLEDIKVRLKMLRYMDPQNQ